MPVVSVAVSLPTGGDPMIVSMMVDTGADRTLLPISIVRDLALPEIDAIRLRGIDEARKLATVHDAAVTLAGIRSLVQVVAFADEAILGRDVLNQFIATFDGPALTLSIASPRRKRPT
jgi:predicted aspartyl protease